MRTPCPSLRRKASSLDLISGRRRIAIESLNRLARIFREILADEIELAQELVRHGDDVAAALLGMEDVQELARAGPKQLRLRARSQDLLAGEHMGDGIDAGIGDTAGEHRDDRRRGRIERIRNGENLIEREDRRSVEQQAV